MSISALGGGSKVGGVGSLTTSPMQSAPAPTNDLVQQIMTAIGQQPASPAPATPSSAPPAPATTATPQTVNSSASSEADQSFNPTSVAQLLQQLLGGQAGGSPIINSSGVGAKTGNGIVGQNPGSTGSIGK